MRGLRSLWSDWGEPVVVHKGIMEALMAQDNVIAVLPTGRGKTISAIYAIARKPIGSDMVYIYTSNNHNAMATAFQYALRILLRIYKVFEAYAKGRRRSKFDNLLERFPFKLTYYMGIEKYCPVVNVMKEEAIKRGIPPMEFCKRRCTLYCRTLEHRDSVCKRLILYPRAILRYLSRNLKEELESVSLINEYFRPIDYEVNGEIEYCPHVIYNCISAWRGRLVFVPHALFNLSFIIGKLKMLEGSKLIVILDEFDEFILSPEPFPIVNPDDVEEEIKWINDVIGYLKGKVKCARGNEKRRLEFKIEALERVLKFYEHAKAHKVFRLLQPWVVLERLREANEDMSKIAPFSLSLKLDEVPGIRRDTRITPSVRKHYYDVLFDRKIAEKIGVLKKSVLAPLTLVFSPEFLAPWTLADLNEGDENKGKIYFFVYSTGEGEYRVASYDHRLAFVFKKSYPVYKKVVLLSASPPVIRDLYCVSNDNLGLDSVLSTFHEVLERENYSVERFAKFIDMPRTDILRYCMGVVVEFFDAPLLLPDVRDEVYDALLGLYMSTVNRAIYDAVDCLKKLSRKGVNEVLVLVF